MSAQPSCDVIEQALLGALLQDPAAFARVQPMEPAHFADAANATIYAAIATPTPTADPTEVYLRLQRTGAAERCGGMKYLDALAQGVPSAANAARHAQLLRAEAARREALALLDKARADLAAASDPAEALAAVSLAMEEQRGAAAPPPMFTRVRLGDLNDPPPPRVYWWADYLPAGVVTLLSAHGDTGKSYITLMLAACIAAGRDLFGKPTRRGRVLYYSAEDGADIVRERMHYIARGLEVSPADLDAGLHILDATEIDPALFRESGALQGRCAMPTPALKALSAYCDANAIDVLMIDNASDVFDAPEIQRAAVRAFMRQLATLAKPGRAVLLLAHVDKGTARGTAGGADAYSGSTAWHNSARSRLFLARDKDGGLTLEQQKANLSARRAPPLRLIWPENMLPTVDGPSEPIVRNIAERNDTMALLRLIHEFTQRGEFVSTATTSRTHAGKLLRGQPGFPARLTDPELFDLLREAERRGLIERDPFKGADRKPRERWLPTDTGLREARIAATAATAATSRDFGSGSSGAVPAEPAATAATSPPGGMGGKSAHTKPTPT